MAPASDILRLPNGQNLTVRPVFGGFFFKSDDTNLHSSIFPAGWTVVLETEDYFDPHHQSPTVKKDPTLQSIDRKHCIHPFKTPTLHNDNLFISSISNPPSSDLKAPASPTTQIAMMLWVSLYWYFLHKAPPLHVTTEASKNTPDAGKPRGEWRINIKREGVLRARNLIQKLERMGLAMSEDSSVGLSPEECTADGWSEMFMSRRVFWQLPARLFLFSLIPTSMASHTIPVSPYGSRPGSPVRGERNQPANKRESGEYNLQPSSPSLWSPATAGPFCSGSHLPTYWPPGPGQYIMSSGVRHPIRPKPPRQGETFYTRYIPSVGQYLSFRIASLSNKPVAFNGPTVQLHLPHHNYHHHHHSHSLSSLPVHLTIPSNEDITSSTSETNKTCSMSDLQLLHKWMNNTRISKFWGCAGPVSVQENYLRSSLMAKHSFPAIGLWDGKPFGYFEIYWVKEDILGRHLGDATGSDWDRGLHVLVGEDEFRGKHRVMCWLTSLAHWAFLEDSRTNSVVLEPRVDNDKFIAYLQETGFLKEKEVTLPHKQSALMKLRRENFEAPMI